MTPGDNASKAMTPGTYRICDAILKWNCPGCDHCNTAHIKEAQAVDDSPILELECEECHRPWEVYRFMREPGQPIPLSSMPTNTHWRM